MLSSPTSWRVTLPVSNPVSVRGRVASIAGASLRAHYRGRALSDWVEGGGGAPDIVTAINLHGDGAYNITNNTESQQPHSGTVLTYPAITFDESAAQKLLTTGVSPVVGSAGDDFTTICVMRKNGTAVGSDVIVEVGLGTTVSTGLLLYMTPGELKAQALVADNSQKGVTAVLTDTASIHLARATLDSTGVHIALDGTVLSTLGTFNGLKNGPNSIAVGGSIQGILSAGLAMFETVILQNPTAAIIAELEAFLANYYGVTLA